MAANPMHQFKVHTIGPEIEISGVNLSFTNASLFMTISGVLIIALLLLGTREKKLIPNIFMMKRVPNYSIRFQNSKSIIQLEQNLKLLKSKI